jgi:hypothetical protein
LLQGAQGGEQGANLGVRLLACRNVRLQLGVAAGEPELSLGNVIFPFLQVKSRGHLGRAVVVLPDRPIRESIRPCRRRHRLTPEARVHGEVCQADRTHDVLLVPWRQDDVLMERESMLAPPALASLIGLTQALLGAPVRVVKARPAVTPNSIEIQQLRVVVWRRVSHGWPAFLACASA